MRVMRRLGFVRRAFSRGRSNAGVMQGAPQDRRQRGQSLTELAIAFTFLMLLLAGMVDLGRAFFSLVALRDAAQEGAVYGALNPTDTAGIENHVRTSSNSPVNLADTVAVGVSSTIIGSACAGNQVRVTVTYNFQLTMPLIGVIVGSQQLPLSATMTNTIITPAC